MNYTSAVATYSTVPATESFFEPRVVKSRLSAHKHAEIEDAIADTKKRRARRRAEKTLSKTPAAAPIEEGHAFDRAGYTAFVRSRSAEIKSLSESDQERLLEEFQGFFRGHVMGARWFAILGMLTAIRKASEPPAVAVNPQRRHWLTSETPPHGGW